MSAGRWWNNLISLNKCESPLTQLEMSLYDGKIAGKQCEGICRVVRDEDFRVSLHTQSQANWTDLPEEINSVDSNSFTHLIFCKFLLFLSSFYLYLFILLFFPIYLCIPLVLYLLFVFTQAVEYVSIWYVWLAWIYSEMDADMDSCRHNMSQLY